VVFSVFLKTRLDPGRPSGLNNYALHLLCGMLPWSFFAGSVLGSIGSIVGNANLIKKTYFPRQLIPASAVGAALVTHLIEMGLLVVVLVGFGNWRAIAFLPLVVVLTAVTMIFGLGVGLTLSALNVFFRDIEHFTGILFQVWFFATPIVYPITVIHQHTVAQLLKVNPMTDLVLCYQSVLYNGAWPSVLEFAYALAAALVALAVGLAVFGRVEGRMAEEL
jgi:ABC-2 type transport system permease protein